MQFSEACPILLGPCTLQLPCKHGEATRSCRAGQHLGHAAAGAAATSGRPVGNTRGEIRSSITPTQRVSTDPTGWCVIPVLSCSRGCRPQERSPAKLDAFFRAFGAAEAACMCYQLAAAPLSAVPAVRHFPSSDASPVCSVLRPGGSLCWSHIHTLTAQAQPWLLLSRRGCSRQHGQHWRIPTWQACRSPRPIASQPQSPSLVQVHSPSILSLFPRRTLQIHGGCTAVGTNHAMRHAHHLAP
jgi:hypothetical protein